MKNKYIIFLLLLTAFSFSACIQDEAPNAECDILDVNLSAGWFKDNENILTGEFKIKNNEVIFKVKKETDFATVSISHESIMAFFTLTPGAKIEKYSGNVTNKIGIKNDKNGIELWCTVYAENGIWSKDYKITFIKTPLLDPEHIFSFENIDIITTPKGQEYNSWYEINKDGIRSDIWSSGNAGFATVAGKKPASEYPTTASSEGFSGDCVKLTTRTAPGGSIMKMPIAAGSIFIGNFDSENATKLKEKATHFGLQIIPEGHKPIALKGYYKYTAGTKFTDKNNKEVKDRRDECSIYAVLFEIDQTNFIPLDGSNITSSDRIVLMANLEEPGEPENWKEFDIPFEPMNGKEFDYEKLRNNEYAITIVASSSKNGAFFEGAVGSTLFIDELKIEWEKE